MQVPPLLFAALASFIGHSTAAPAIPELMKRQSSNSTGGRPTTYDAHIIDMPIDHFQNSFRYAPHTNDTFKQRYFFDTTYYKPGGPVFLYIGGETPGEYRFSDLSTGIIQILMNATNGLGVILENRYYGESQPFNTSTTDQLRFLTTEQTIADNAYFAQHATFPGVQGNLSAPGTPWILYGGSLAGAQTAFSLVTYQGLLWAGIASSATIHSTLSYPEWYNPIQKYGPQDCITNINNIIDKMDGLINSKNTAAIQQLKELFGLGSLSDIRDFAEVLSFPIGGPVNYPTNTWQELNWDPDVDAPDFFLFCHNITDVNAPANITAADTAFANYTNGEAWTGLGAYANYVQQVIVSQCPDPSLINTTTCFSTQNQSFWADTTTSLNRAYLYSICTEGGLYQSAPSSGPSLISRVIQPSYTQQWCQWAFPAGNYSSIPSNGPDLSYIQKYGDLNLTAPRLVLIDGNVDVWKDACYHSDEAPQRYGDNQYLIAGAGHHWDSYGILDIDAEPDYIAAAHQYEINRVQAFLTEFNQTRGGSETRDEL